MALTALMRLAVAVLASVSLLEELSPLSLVSHEPVWSFAGGGESP